MIEKLQYMLNIIDQISKKAENFHELEGLQPLLAELKKSDIDSKQTAEYLKVINELLPKLKGKSPASTRGDSMFQVYDRMSTHLSLELNKLNFEFDETNNSAARISLESDEQIKAQTQSLIKEIEDMLAGNKKIVLSYITSKRKQYLSPENKHYYLYKKLNQKIQFNSKLKTRLQNLKYEFGKYRCLYNMHQTQSRSPQLQIEVQRLQNGRQTGMSEEMMSKIEKKIEFQKRKEFLLNSCQYVEKQCPFVLAQLKKFENLQNPGEYQQKLYTHYISWGVRLKILIENVLIKISVFQRNPLRIRQQETFLDLSRQIESSYSDLLCELSKVLE